MFVFMAHPYPPQPREVINLYTHYLMNRTIQLSSYQQCSTVWPLILEQNSCYFYDMEDSAKQCRHRKTSITSSHLYVKSK